MWAVPDAAAKMRLANAIANIVRDIVCLLSHLAAPLQWPIKRRFLSSKTLIGTVSKFTRADPAAEYRLDSIQLKFAPPFY